MKKTLITILIILLLITIGFMLFNSLHIFGLHIFGLRELNDENQKIESSIQNLSRLSSVEYQQAINNVSKSAKEYEKAKSEYDQLVEISSGNEVLTANQLQKYEIEYLWTRIGKHASDEDVTLKIEILENGTSAATGYYDLNFTAEGDYVGITDFVYDIENDSSLGFKIEKFKMIPSGTTTNNNRSNNNNNQKENANLADQRQVTLSATFTCTNVAINIDPSLIVRPETAEGENTENTNNTNTNSTENTNTNSNTNTYDY